jgi:glycerol uptake facilitator-like aquaporin
MVPRKDDESDSREMEMGKSVEAAPDRRALEPAPSGRPAEPVELIITVALALSTVVAVTVVSIGIARAEVFGARADGDVAPLAIALLIGLLLSAMGGLTAVMADGRKHRN